MRSYLLGFLPEDEAAALEQQYFADRAVFLRLQAEETALIADYLDGRLRPWEKTRFEARYLKVPVLQRKVEEVRRQRAVDRPAARPSIWAWRPLFASAALVLVLGLGLGLWVYRNRQANQAQSVAQVKPAENPGNETRSDEQPPQPDGAGQASLSSELQQPSAALDPNLTVFIASNRMYLVGDTDECAVTAGDILLRTVSAPDENNRVDVNVVKSKQGDCPEDTYWQAEVRDLQEMHERFQEKQDSHMQRLQALAKQAPPQTAAMVASTPPPGNAPTPSSATASAAAANSAASPQPSVNQTIAANPPANAPPRAEYKPRALPDAAPAPDHQPLAANADSPSVASVPGRPSHANARGTTRPTPGGTFPPSMQERLEAQFPFARGTDGCHVGNPDTALVAQRNVGGMRILPVSSTGATIAKCTNHYTDGKLKTPSTACNGEKIAKAGGWLSHVPRVGGVIGAGGKVGDQAAQQPMDVVTTGDTVYPVKLEVDEGKGEVKFSIITCKQSGDQLNPYKGEIIFHFAPGTLTVGNSIQVEDTIAEVFNQAGGDAQGKDGADQDSGAQAQQANHDQQQDDPASTCNPEVGQTVAQVEGACGAPASIAKGAGTKAIYIYNHPKLRITFVNGRVADIE
ncbi:MAG: hypothetical protein LAO20_07535 [Acidobacteriia bacterium]|nr:hypothetical protein [Terriglobia bacterium]